MANQIVVKKINETTKGLFTRKAWLKDQIILKLAGKSVKETDLKNYTQEQQADLLQIGPALFWDMKGEHEFYLRHHCNPNCSIKIAANTAFLLALREINQDEELTFDYSTTSTDTPEEWQMLCGCHRFFCRGAISGFRNLPEKRQQEMIEKGMVPRYVKNLVKK